MNQREKLEWLEYFYWGYFGASIVTILISIIYLIKLYIFTLEVTTIADIFLILVLLLSSFYFRYNAFHYQNLVMQLKKEEI
ncbi:hypothetical protein [Isobaculum melis]|uniref:Uncharacterized protein n=1 Tax=Isobaculum melis TaxID=142588 RepID=A0A1H9S2Z7_9LACT|nr:hypothetical protein [Isobaculum melis]SER79314.1 hypothetical protein SAMN04488559_10669 [Isobaculum melis]